MSTSSTDIESQSTPGSLFSRVARRWRLAVGVALVVGVVAAVGVCAAVLVKTNTFESGKDIHARAVSQPSNIDSESEVIRNKRLPPRANAVPQRVGSPCDSEISNDTLPAAHLKGHGLQWGTGRENRNGPKYPADWDCSGSPAFVSGGMRYQPEDKSLYVPKCGWYSLFSQILFQSNDNTDIKNYLHTLRVDRNCEGSDQNSYSLSGYTTIGPMERTNRQDQMYVRSSTIVGDVVKICEGGRIWIEIPEGNPCCPHGDETVTSLSVYLVAQDNC